MKTETWNLLTKPEVAALMTWAKAFPKSWQPKLMNAWLTGNYCGVDSDVSSELQGIRNRVNDAKGNRLPSDLTERMALLAKVVRLETPTNLSELSFIGSAK